MNCESFHDRILELVSGRLEAVEVRALLEHADECRDCGSVLSLEEALQGTKSEGMAERVPDEWVTAMWPRIRASMEPATSTRLLRSRRHLGPGRVAIAAVAALVLVGAGFVLGQRLESIGAGGSNGGLSRIEATVSSPTPASRGELREALEQLPDAMTLVSAARANALLEGSTPLQRWLRDNEVALDISDGVQTIELRRILDSLPDGVILPSAAMAPGEIRRWLERRV